MRVPEVGTKVRKNTSTWKSTEFDAWGRGEGIGIVVEPPFALAEGEVDVRWPAGRCFEHVEGLVIVEDSD